MSIGDKYAFQLAGLTDADLRRIAELVRRYADRRLDGTNASVIAICGRLAILTVATVNLRDFAKVRPHHVTAQPQSRSTRRRTDAAPGLIPRASRRTAAERNNADIFGMPPSDRTYRKLCVVLPDAYTPALHDNSRSRRLRTRFTDFPHSVDIHT